MKQCKMCGIDFEPKRESAQFCSPKCRVTFNRGVTLTSDNVTLSESRVTLTPKFRFTVTYNKKPGDLGYDSETADNRKKVRETVYWYDVPLSAVPVYEKDWPKMPEFMNGRQYFLWWKNEFKMDGDKPEILNPYPQREGAIVVYPAGEGSRRWGA